MKRLSRKIVQISKMQEGDKGFVKRWSCWSDPYGGGLYVKRQGNNLVILNDATDKDTDYWIKQCFNLFCEGNVIFEQPDNYMISLFK
jgi:hypothetical protein